jgi:hypothetical protein
MRDTTRGGSRYPASMHVKKSERKVAKPSQYDVHPGVAMVQEWIAELPLKTGRTLDQWLRLIHREGPESAAQRREWLKTRHGLGTNSAWWLAERAEGKGHEDDDPAEYLKTAERHVEEMYAGKKAVLRPIHDAILRLGRSLGSDVRVCPCKTIVPLYRKHVFAQIKPATLTRIDLGLALGDTKTPARLIDTGGFEKKDRITHRIPLTSVAEIDDEVVRWTKMAYDRDV